jgi:hypothetical protein
MEIQKDFSQSRIIDSKLNENQKLESKKNQQGHSSKDSLSRAPELDPYSLDVKITLKTGDDQKQQTNYTSVCNETSVGCYQTSAGCNQTQTCNC